MKFVLASDSFKGSLDNRKINAVLTDVITKTCGTCDILPLLVADGGDGTLDAVISQMGGRYVPVTVCDPLFVSMQSRYGVFGDTAVISMCECSGLPLLSEVQRDPEMTTSYGTGELIRHAAEHGCRHIYITLGGSATNDGGMGALTALGYRFVKADGTVCRGVGGELGQVTAVDDSGAMDLSGVDMTILSDVTNPMIGPQGATRVFAKQKGASEEQILRLEAGMCRFCRVAEAYTHTPLAQMAGGGAAGGMGASLTAFLHARMRSGIECVLDMIGFDAAIADADVIITGEGRIDSQSAQGKVLSGILSRAKNTHAKVIAIVGTVGDGAERLYDMGLTAMFSLINAPMSLSQILESSEMLYRQTATNVLRLLCSDRL